MGTMLSTITIPRNTQMFCRNAVASITMPPTTQSFPAKRWVLSQLASSFRVQGSLMPTV